MPACRRVVDAVSGSCRHFLVRQTSMRSPLRDRRRRWQPPPRSVFTSGSLHDPVSSSSLRRLRQLAIRIQHELRCSTLIETLISVCSIFERNDPGVDNICNRQPIPQDRLLELAIVFQHRRLSRMKDSTFALPRPKHRDRLPCFAVLSTAPGPSVTYSRGIPIEPAARVASII